VAGRPCKPGQVRLEKLLIGIGQGVDRFVFQAGAAQVGRGRLDKAGDAADFFDQRDEPRAPQAGSADCD
jgi:hypothetical protein